VLVGRKRGALLKTPCKPFTPADRGAVPHGGFVSYRQGNLSTAHLQKRGTVGHFQLSEITKQVKHIILRRTLLGQIAGQWDTCLT